MTSAFDIDPYPGRPKILFIGLGHSSHTHAWVDLLSDAKFNIRLFSVPGGGVPPANWKFATYICEPSQQLPRGLDPHIRQSFHPLPEEIDRLQEEMNRLQKEQDRFQEKLQERNKKLRRNPIYWLFLFTKKVLNAIGSRLGMPALYYDYSLFHDLHPPGPTSISEDQADKYASPDEWLAKIIQDWQPDIIHTLGIFDGQGGLFYYYTRMEFALKKMGVWLLELRGGSDITLRQHNPEAAKQIYALFQECDQINTDNYYNIKYIKELGFGDKVASIAPILSTGGIDVDVNLQNLFMPSQRKRIIYWPKGYESVWSKAVPVIEAIKLAWDEIKPCTIHITATNEESANWLGTLPEEIRKNCHLQPRIPREQALETMKQARVMLAPSLVDGIPNVLYEAMANGAFPIVSPLETMTPIVSEPQNTLFARNLYPQEIADAIVKAMNDDCLVDKAAKNNLILAEKLASRGAISKRVVNYYFNLSGYDNLNGQSPLVSVIIPFHNRIDWTLEAVRSVLRQMYQNFEIILVDDGSTESLDPLFDFDDSRIRIIHQSNKGPAAARNHGMKEAKGDYIAFLDSDDVYEPTKLMVQLRIHLNNPDVWFTHTSYRYFSAAEAGELIHSGKFSGSVYPDIYYGCPIAPSTVMFKREVIERNIIMQERYKISEDIIFFAEVARYSKIIGIDIPLTLFRKTHSTHALSPRAQIAGSKNILDYLQTSNVRLTSPQKKTVFFQIFNYIGYNYELLKKPFGALYHYSLALLYSENKVIYFREKLLSIAGSLKWKFLKLMRKSKETNVMEK